MVIIVFKFGTNVHHLETMCRACSCS